MTEKKTRFAFDPKISMGHIISIVTLLVATVGFFLNTETKINSVSHKSELRDLRIQRDFEKMDYEIQSQVDKTVMILEYLTDEVTELKDAD